MTPATPRNTKLKNKKGNRSKVRSVKATVKATPSALPEPLTFEESQKMVEFNLGNKIARWNINDPLEVYSIDDLPKDENDDIKVDIPTPPPEPMIQLPEASFKELENYNICDAPPRPNAYIRFIEKSTEELDGEVEYDVDEEDTAWLSIMNAKRETAGQPPVSVDSLELLMDRLEKESYFQASVNGHTGAVVDDDAVCCICMDGECQNTNVILFCDMCNLAVHQDCYGVPYIPEGQWLCRRCLQSPSRAVDCVLCPNQGGAFKQTDKNQWAHVVCALWIPEVRFANTVFLEPIDSIETIPAARWKLPCIVCKQKGSGACIQCHKNSCYQAFHVTCAQQAGLYMKMHPVNEGVENQPVVVEKVAYCDAHAPSDLSEGKKEDSKQKIKNARKMLAKKRTSAPIILIPTIPPDRIQEIGSLVTMTKKSQFIQRLIAYWTLKRQYRNGVPLLRRLQSAQGGSRDALQGNVDILELCRQLKYWQNLRRDLERARLLCELVRKREKTKLLYVRQVERYYKVQLKPLEASLENVLNLIAMKDTNEIFSEPVDLDEVPDYMTVVSEPMDLSTMRLNLEKGLYPDLKSMEKDFDLMIANCLAYNNRDTVFYRAAIKMRDQCAVIFRQARKELESAGLLNENVVVSHYNDESLSSEIDRELEILQSKTGPDVVTKLEELLIKSQSLKHGMARAKRTKLIKNELTKAKKNLANAGSSQSENETENADLKKRTAANAKKTDNSLSPVVLLSDIKNVKKKRGRAKKQEETPTKDLQSIPDSFRVYRAGERMISDDENTCGSNCSSISTCYSHNPSEIETDEDDSMCSDSTATAVLRVEEGIGKKILEPFTLVWAKCRGYPWYPALIIDPTMPSGYIHQGVPMPSPPAEVLALSSNYEDHVYLVLFFDAKRTWQWLPADKLELLGINPDRDEAKVNEPKKPADRKAVKKAYENAQQYILQIAEFEEGQPS